MFHHIQALVRETFMSCEKLGNKEERFSAYRIVMSDFLIYMGEQRFPMTFRKSINEKDPHSVELFEAWEEKESKLQSILTLVKSYDPENNDKNVLEYFYQIFIQAKNQNISSDPTVNGLKKIMTAYWQNQHRRSLESLKKIPANELPLHAAFNLKYSKFKDEYAQAVTNLFSGNSQAISEYNKYSESL
jgi:hypothetical protein